MPNYISKERLEELKLELEQLKNSKRKEIAKRIENAIALGDLSENAEYHEAREQQAFNEGKIQELEELTKNAIIIKPSSNVSSGIIEVGDTVEISKNGEKITF